MQKKEEKISGTKGWHGKDQSGLKSRRELMMMVSFGFFIPEEDF